jgi:hypothetical protein
LTREIKIRKERTNNSSYPKGGVWCSKDSFVVNGTLVFQIKFCGKSPATLPSPKTLIITLNNKIRKNKINKLAFLSLQNSQQS